MISIISIAFGNTKDTYEQLEVLDRPEFAGKLEVILTDNNYDSSSLESFKPNYVTYDYKHYGNLGFAAGVNLAIERANPNTEYYLLLNPDCVITPENITKIMKYADETKKTIFAPLLVNDNRKPIENYKRKWSVLSTLLYRSIPYAWAERLFQKRHEKVGVPETINWILGAFIVIPRTYIEEYGLLDNAYFLCADDMADLLIRNNGDYTIAINKEIVITHHGGGSSKYVRKSALAWAYYGHCYFFKKNSNWVYYLLMSFTLSGFLALRILATFFYDWEKLKVFIFAFNGIFMNHEVLTAMVKKEFG